MSERTTIGGTVYESIGSSKSNLLLKCNGTARIQWGNKLIDLIKNGKLAISESQNYIFIISDTSEISKNGIYIINNEDSIQVYISKDGEIYSLIGTDLYIQANKEQNITVEQKEQVLKNIGLCYNTLEDLQSSGIKNGFAYVISSRQFYTIIDGLLEEAQLNNTSATVEEENKTENDTSSSQQTFNLRPEETSQEQEAVAYGRFATQPFFKGMVVLFSDTEEIPEGWAVCDGQEYTYEEITTKTPDLRDLNSNSLIYIIKL